MKSIIVFASGAGSNFSSIMQYAKTTDTFSIALLVVNKEDAPVIQLAKEQAIPVLLLNKETFNSTEWIATLTAYQPSLIVLAGFLWKLPEHMVHAFPNKIINIHPALLPKYGGKGMYGMRVHQAVKDAKENESGGTDHGTAAPHFLMSGSLEGGLWGIHPDLGNLKDGDVQFTTDYRVIYDKILSDWFGLEQNRFKDFRSKITDGLFV